MVTKLEILHKFNFLIRFYPAADLKSFKIINSKNFSFSKNTLDTDCKLSRIAIFGNTSAGLEAVNNGLISIWADLTLKNLSPLSENHRKLFFPSFDSANFQKNIYKVAIFKKKQFDLYQKKQSIIVKNIYSKINSKNINFLTQSNK